MAYTEFSTENADYILHLGNHSSLPLGRGTNFKGIDGLVIETWGGEGYWDFEKVSQRIDKSLLDWLEKEKIQVYHVDPMITPLGFLRHLSSAWFHLPVVFIPILYTSRNKKIDGLLEKIYSDWSFVLQTPPIAGRNAISAKKIEEYVVPRLKNLKKVRRPKIGLIYGILHMGLKYDIKSQRRRNLTIKNYRNFNFGKFSGLISEGLVFSALKNVGINDVYEASYDKTRWNVEKITPPIIN